METFDGVGREREALYHVHAYLWNCTKLEIIETILDPQHVLIRCPGLED